MVCGVEPRVPMLPMWRPHPIFLFRAGKRKMGEKEKALCNLSGGGRPTPCLAASPVSLRASPFYKKE